VRSAELVSHQGALPVKGEAPLALARCAPRQLRVSIGQCSDRGRKEINQDFYGTIIPSPPLLGSKGIAVVLADGISSSFVSRIASEAAVKTFLEDYYCTSETWSVKTSAQRVIAAVNSWLFAQTRRGANPYDKDKGYVCTLTAMVIKSTTAHIFHIGDARVYRLHGAALDQLTDDHRVVLSSEQSYLGRALGANPQVEIDYHALPVAAGDMFVLATDGVYEHVAPRFVTQAIDRNVQDLEAAARVIVEEAHRRGSPDNTTLQIVRIDEVPDGNADELLGEWHELPLPPLLEAGGVFDGYRIVRELHASSRSHVYLATDLDDGKPVVVKVPSIDLRDDPAYLKQFMMEEWVLRRVNNPHLLKSAGRSGRRSYLYVVTEFVDGQSLTQWMLDNPHRDLETVRVMIEQIAAGLQALHRMEMLHRDLRPENIIIDKTGTVKIIDFGSVSIAGVTEAAPTLEAGHAPGTFQYMAPEYFLGEGGTAASDLFSLGVIAYQLLTGGLPYGADVARAKSRSEQRKLRYRSSMQEDCAVPMWVDGAIRCAVHPVPAKRYQELSEFIFDLRQPNRTYLDERQPLLQRDPLLFWKLLSALLAIIVLALLVRLARY
jgi:serine/threonine protein phosphatase PrpC/predicted Ser/Thr protein kinase